jgi:hypothetical protein
MADLLLHGREFHPRPRLRRFPGVLRRQPAAAQCQGTAEPAAWPASPSLVPSRAATVIQNPPALAPDSSLVRGGHLSVVRIRTLAPGLGHGIVGRPGQPPSVAPIPGRGGVPRRPGRPPSVVRTPSPTPPSSRPSTVSCANTHPDSRLRRPDRPPSPACSASTGRRSSPRLVHASVVPVGHR